MIYLYNGAKKKCLAPTNEQEFWLGIGPDTA